MRLLAQRFFSRLSGAFLPCLVPVLIVSYRHLCSSKLFPASPSTMSDACDLQKFTVGLYNSVVRTSKPTQNIAVSPFSVDSALSMTYIGAVGDTKSELGSALGLASDTTAKCIGEKLQAVNTTSDNFTLQSANAMYLGDPYQIKPDYSSQIKGDFKAEIKSVDFAHDPDAVRQEINTFAEEKTNHKIKDLLPSGSLDSDTIFVLVNAVYFKANWQKEFNAAETQKDQTFTLPDGQEKKVDMMHTTDKFNYTEVESWGHAQVLELTYKGSETSMVFILPQAETGLDGVEKAFTSDILKKVFSELKERNEKIRVYVPKFKVSTDYDLVEQLKTLGVKKAFGNGADFSGITASDVYISKVQHKVFVEVDEKGTEAAAATAAVGKGRSLGPRVFRADRPFLFLIRHNTSNTILFVGRISDPTVAK